MLGAAIYYQLQKINSMLGAQDNTFFSSTSVGSMELDAWIGLCSRYNMDTGDTINLMLNKSEWVLIN